MAVVNGGWTGLDLDYGPLVTGCLTHLPHGVHRVSCTVLSCIVTTCFSLQDGETWPLTLNVIVIAACTAVWIVSGLLQSGPGIRQEKDTVWERTLITTYLLFIQHILC